MVLTGGAANSQQSIFLFGVEIHGTSAIVGPTGATGATGVGLSGATGPTGSNGANGATGATGNNGANGATGATGNDGATGKTGPNGATGPTGNNGANGPPGLTGATGMTGATGAASTVAGPPGPTGATGNMGNPGSAGAAGATGATGAVSTTYWQMHAFFNNGNETGVALYYEPDTTDSNNGATSIAFSSSNQTMAPSTCKMSNLNVGAYVQKLYPSGSPGTATITVFHATGNATPTTTLLKCTTGTITSAVGAQASCSNTSNADTVSIAAGDLLSLQLIEASGSSETDSIYYSVTISCE